MRIIIMAFSLLMLMALPAYAVNPDEVLDDPVLEERARSLSTHLRCLVCQNQSIDESDAGLAKDLRVLVRERLTIGDTDKEVIDYVVARYGEFVLLKPRIAIHTLFAWASPFLIIGVGLLVIALRVRASKKTKLATVKGLSVEEEAELNEILKN